MAGTANKPKTVITTGTNVQDINCAIKSIQVYANGDNGVRYRVTLDTVIDAIKKELGTDNYVQAQVDYIDFVPSVIIAQCINHIEGLDVMYTKKKESGLRNDNNAGFGAAELQVVLRGAKLVLRRTKFEAGSEYTTSGGEILTHEHEGYNTDIIGVKVSDKVQVKLDSIIDNLFDI